MIIFEIHQLYVLIPFPDYVVFFIPGRHRNWLMHSMVVVLFLDLNHYVSSAMYGCSYLNAMLYAIFRCYEDTL